MAYTAVAMAAGLVVGGALLYTDATPLQAFLGYSLTGAAALIAATILGD